MRRELTEWEREVVHALASIDSPHFDPERVRASSPHLVVTGGCECGCASFNVADRRSPDRPYELGHYSTGLADGVGFDLWLGPDGRPISIDVDNETGLAPDIAAIQVWWGGEIP